MNWTMCLERHATRHASQADSLGPEWQLVMRLGVHTTKLCWKAVWHRASHKGSVCVDRGREKRKRGAQEEAWSAPWAGISTRLGGRTAGRGKGGSADVMGVDQE